MADSYQWLNWAKTLQAIAQNGLTYCESIFDRERYLAIQQIAAQIMGNHSQLDTQAILQLLQLEQGYATPKIDVRGAVFRDDKILLVQEQSDQCWSLPGGWAEINTSPAEAIVKEIREESGYEAKAVRLLALYDSHKHPHPPDIRHFYKCFFLCEIIGGEAKTSHETLAVDFFPRDNLPPLSTPRVLTSQIDYFFECRHHPEWPTAFD